MSLRFPNKTTVVSNGSDIIVKFKSNVGLTI